MILKNTIAQLMILVSVFSYGQENLLDELESETPVSYVSNTTSVFKGLKIINLESTKFVKAKDFYFVIAHRFSSVENGFEDLFGIDNANIRFSFVYGLNNWWNVGLSRSSLRKIYDLNSKIKFTTQKEGSTYLNSALYVSLGYESSDERFLKSIYPGLNNSHRMVYVGQLLLSRKIKNQLSVELAPTIVHRNFVFDNDETNTQFVTMFGAAYKLSSMWSLTTDFSYLFNRLDTVSNNMLAVGVDIETGGHVFQLHLSNSQSMYESNYINAEGNWSKGQVFLGFNISRVF
ncbi:DUF5777 family beta-barrel protein [Flavobacteriaceae bacterium]|nr:DUF5777 family beta-barrel protein [Flavobacteriaceae bacterium]